MAGEWLAIERSPLIVSGTGLSSLLPIGRTLGPTWGRIFKVFLPPIGGRIEEAIGIGEGFYATTIG